MEPTERLPQSIWVGMNTDDLNQRRNIEVENGFQLLLAPYL